MKKILSFLLLFSSISLFAGPRNIAPLAKVRVSDQLNDSLGASGINDNVIMHDGDGEWACKGSVSSSGSMHYPWVILEWEDSVEIEKVIFYDRVNLTDHLSGGTLTLSDGSTYSVLEIPNNGSPKAVHFPSRKVKWLKFQATDGAGKDIGLSEIQVMASLSDKDTPVYWADPLIETTRGRWFFCTPGGLPMGMVAVHAFTRNKNQGGGGYNYNFPEILGFSQINDWMVSGPNLMPVAGEINPEEGIDGWKSGFSHDSEEIRPGYHKVFLDKYATWTEYTATDRTASYRMDYTREPGGLVVDAGSVLGNCTMTEAVLHKVNDCEIEGRFQTVKRLWGGPDKVQLCFVLRSDVPFSDVKEYKDCGRMLLEFGRIGIVNVKIGLSYVSEENARENLDKENPDWDFDATAGRALRIWDEMFSRIEVRGKDNGQVVKFYTDLWHVLLGRHKISDCNGDYPDYTYMRRGFAGKRTADPMMARTVPLQNGKPAFNMYGFDALWLTQWNLNVLWGIAWPEILDDFTACLVQYADNGGLLPRGACSGGYSMIMRGCPATSMIVSTFMQGYLRKTDPVHAFEAIKRNHLPGGMLGIENDDDLKFYIKNGWCPDNAGHTLQWVFEDWGAAKMANKLGRKKDAREFERRSHGWITLFDRETGYLLPKDKDGIFLHKNILSGKGWIEANSAQATWSVSHDLAKLAELMGGGDIFCEKLNDQFEQSASQNFVSGYGSGYISYANQPGCSDAHVFSYGGKPWLTQYWVRRVREQAYGGITPDLGYGGHDEDQGQMGGVSALMALGLFSVTGCEEETPLYEITTPIFDEIIIHLSKEYDHGGTFTIRNHGNARENYFIQRAELNGKPWNSFQILHSDVHSGGTLDLWSGSEPETDWGVPLKSL